MLSMCAPSVREQGAGIIPIFYLGNRLYTGGCWSADLNSGLCDSGIQVGKQAPERSVSLPVLSLGLSFPICAVGVE